MMIKKKKTFALCTCTACSHIHTRSSMRINILILIHARTQIQIYKADTKLTNSEWKCWEWKKKKAKTTTKYRNYECASIWPISLDHNVKAQYTHACKQKHKHRIALSRNAKHGVYDVHRTTHTHNHKQKRIFCAINFFFIFHLFYYNKTQFTICMHRGDFHFEFWCARCTSNLSYVAAVNGALFSGLSPNFFSFALFFFLVMNLNSLFHSSQSFG